MSEREKLIKLLGCKYNCVDRNKCLEEQADYLLENDVIVPPFSIGQLIDVVFSHNSRVCITVEDENDRNYSKSIFQGMGWEIPDTIQELKCKRIYGCIPENITDSDVLYIEALKALKGGAE